MTHELKLGAGIIAIFALLCTMLLAAMIALGGVQSAQAGLNNQFEYHLVRPDTPQLGLDDSAAVPEAMARTEAVDAYEAGLARNEQQFDTVYKLLVATSILTIMLASAVGIMGLRLLRDKRRDDARDRDLAARDRTLSAARKEAIEVVAHDLRNPLSAIILASQIARLEPTGQRLDQTTPMLEHIERAARSMDRLIGNLLDHAKIEAGTLQLDRLPVALAPLLEELIARNRAIAGENAVTLVLDLPAELPRPLLDEARIEQVLTNLLGNAIKFSPRGGTVTTTVSVAPDALRIAITDQGPGLSAEARERAFERYWQGAKATHGTGLGLAISKAIVDAHDGSIAIDSEPGHGCTFTVTLPLGTASGNAIAQLAA